MPFDLVVAAKLAGTALKFVEGGPLAEALAALNLQAAISALNKTQDAKDKRSQVWSAINHLEGALAALESKLRGRGGNVQYVLRGWNYHLLCVKRGYVLALMAICYVYLGEDELAEKAVEQGRYYPAGDVPLAIRTAGFVSSFLVPVDLLRYDPEAVKYQVDWDHFRLPPRGW